MNKIAKIKDNITYSIKKRIADMSSKEKLIGCLVLVIVFFILSMILTRIRDNSSQIIDYKTYNGELLYYSGTAIDNDTFATVNNIANDLIKKYNRFGDYKVEKKSFKNEYNATVYNEFKDIYSEKKYFKLLKDVYSNIGKSANANGDIIPEGIVRFIDNYYIMRYSYVNENGENIYSYIGICLDTIKMKYYIWYLE